MAGEDDHTECDGEVIGRTFLADGSGRKIDNDAMTGKMQAGVLDSGLYTLAAFLHGGIGKANDDNGRKPVGVIHFNFDNDTFKPDDGAGKYSC